MNGTPSERPARTAAERTLDTLRYFFEAALDDARMVLRTAQAIVRDREHSAPADASAAGRLKQPAARSQQSTPLTEAQVREIRRRYQPGEAASALARKYGRARTTIHDIACRRSWKHIPPGPGEYRQPAPPAPDKTTPAPHEASVPENTTTTGGSAGPTTPAPKESEPAAPTPADVRTTVGCDTTATPRRTPAAATKKKEAAPSPTGSGQDVGMNSQLTEAQVREIRRAYQPGGKTKTLATKYGVSTNTVLNIAHRRTWKHLKPESGEYQLPADTAGSPETPPANPAPLRGKHVGASARTIAAATANGSDRGKRKAAPGGPAAPDVDAEKKRLSPESIRSIREQAAEGVKARRIARSFGVSEDTVHALAG